MNISLIILLVAFILIILGYATDNRFFTLAGGFLVLISGLLFLSDPLNVESGVVINQTSDTVYEVTPQTSSPSPLLNHSFNVILLLIGMMFMYDSYIHLREKKYAQQER